MRNIIPGKTSAQIPNVNGEFDVRSSGKGAVVLLLGVQCNQYVSGVSTSALYVRGAFADNKNPMGIFHEEFRKVGKLFNKMNQDLEEHREEYTCKIGSIYLHKHS